MRHRFVKIECSGVFIEFIEKNLVWPVGVLAHVEVVASATGSASPTQGKGFSSGFNLRLVAGSGLSTHVLFALFFC